MMKRTNLATLLTLCWTGAARADDLAWLDAYNLAWTTPCANSSESMPVGGHDMGLNVWVEDGELLIYLARAGRYDENGALLKLGRLRVNLEPNPFAGDGVFRQELKLREGCVEIRARQGETPEAPRRPLLARQTLVELAEDQADRDSSLRDHRLHPVEQRLP